jgi:hypothetical protein
LLNDIQDLFGQYIIFKNSRLRRFRTFLRLVRSVNLDA